MRTAALISLGCALSMWAWRPGPSAEAAAGPATMVATSSTGALRHPIRGMTVSCPIYGEIWGTEAFSESLVQLREMGVAWAAIHPYARIEKNGEVRFTMPEATGYLPAAVARAKAAGVALFWKPHLAYWGRFEWRGAIGFGSDTAAWERFFRTYREFILAHARFAETHGIPLLAVGTELEQMMGYEKKWRDLIKEIRGVYRGRLTWAPNWDGVAKVPFWDALDYIGVQAYFPLPLAEGAPTKASVRAAWAGPLRTLGELARSFERPVLFTEVGYPDADHAAITPWKSGQGRGSAAELRRNLVEVAATTVEEVPFVAGMFWWKWMPGSAFGRGDFRMTDGLMRETLKKAWKARAERPPAR